MKLRVGVVGCGKIADAHVEQIQVQANASLVAVCDAEPIMAEQLATRFGIAQWYEDLGQMLAKERLDVVHVTTPPQSHLAVTRAVVNAGCDVFVEKPLATNASEARALIATVEQAGRKLSINYWYNFEPQAIALRDLVAKGRIGEPVHVESFYGYDLGGTYGRALLSDPEHWVHQLPGKLFHNVLDHVLNKITPFLPAKEGEVIARAYQRNDDFNCSDDLQDELRVWMRSGKVSACATFSSNVRPVKHLVHVHGTKNSVLADFAYRTLVLDPTSSLPGALGRLSSPFYQSWAYARQGMLNSWRFAKSEFQFFAGMERLLSLFYASVINDTAPPIAYSEILWIAEMMDDIFAQVSLPSRQLQYS